MRIQVQGEIYESGRSGERKLIVHEKEETSLYSVMKE